MYRPGCFEHYFVHIMRDHKDFIPELDYVIELDGKVVASVMYCKAKLVDEKGNEKDIVTMGPLCVLPEYQRRGLGKALLEHTFEIAKSMGYDVVINFGNPDNYVARGYFDFARCVNDRFVCVFRILCFIFSLWQKDFIKQKGLCSIDYLLVVDWVL